MDIKKPQFCPKYSEILVTLPAQETPGLKKRAEQAQLLTWSSRGHGRSCPGCAVAAAGRDLPHVLPLQHRHQRGLPHVVGVAQPQLPRGNNQQLMVLLQLSKQEFREDYTKSYLSTAYIVIKDICHIYSSFIFDKILHLHPVRVTDPSVKET